MKKINFKPTILILSTTIFLWGCTKDKLEGDLEVFKGRYTWNYSWYKKNVLSSNLTFRSASQSDYTAEIEFTDKGKVIFYINGEKKHKTGYSIESQDVSEGGQRFSIEIKPRKEDTKDLDFNDKISFSLKNDTLSTSAYPGGSYDNTISGTHYFSRN